MDARFTHTTKLVVLLASTLFLALPLCAANPATILAVSPSTTVQLSQVGCNQQQFLTLTSTGTAGVGLTVTASITSLSTDPTGHPYPSTTHGQWLYVTGPGGTTTGGAGLTGIVIPAENSPTGAAGTTLLIGLAKTLANTTDAATVLLHVTSTADNSTVADVPITVNYQYDPTLTCGGAGIATNGVEQISPGSVTLTAVQGNSAQQTLIVTNLTSNSITFTAQGSDTWLTTNSSQPSTLQPNGTVNVVVTAAAGSLAANTYNSSVVFNWSQGSLLTLPTQFTVTQGSGGSVGTLTLNGTTSNAANVSFNYVASGPSLTGNPAAATVTLQTSNSLNNTYSYTVTTSTGSGWLLVNGDSSSQKSGVPLSNGTTLTLQPSTPINFQTGAYTATVTLTTNDGSTASVNVTLYVSSGSATGVTVSPGLIYNFPNVTSGSSTSQAQAFTVTAVSGVVLGVPVQTSNTSIFTLTTQTSSAASETFTITANPTGLSAGVYSTTITITSSGTSSGVTNILATLTVGSSGTVCTTNCGGGGTPVTSVVVPTALYFADSIGNTYWDGGGAQQAVTITGASGTSWSASITYATGQPTGWLTLPNNSQTASGLFGSNPAILPVSMSPPSNLVVGTYTATLAVTTPSGTTNIAVTLRITATTSYVMLGSPASTTFYATGSTLSPQTFRVGDTGEGFPPVAGSTPQSVQVTVPSSASWLTATASGNLVTLTANPAGLTQGAYWTDVSVTAGTYPNSPLLYPVVIVVGSGIGQTNGPLTFNPPSLTFTGTASGTPPANQTFTVTSSTTTTVTPSVAQGSCTPGTTPTWLSVSPANNFSASSTATTLTVSATQAGMAAGTTCTGSIVLTAGTTSQSVPITLTVTSAAANVTVTPPTLTQFTASVGGSAPPAQTVAIANAVSGSAAVSFTLAATYTNGSGWITLTNDQGAAVTTGSTPFNLHIGVNPAGLIAGTYAGTVTVSPTGGTPVPIQVSLTVSSIPTVTATPLSMTFAYSAGGNPPASQTINVSGGGASAGFTATASSSGWLTVTPASGTTPNSGTFPLTVAVANPQNLNAGTYNGTITVAATGSATGTTITQVTLTVTSPLPTISKVISAASQSTGPFSPGELITLFANPANPIGPATPVKLDGTTCPNPCTQVPTTMGGVQVIFLPRGDVAPLLYVSSTQINAVIPYEEAGVQNLQVEVKFLGQTSNGFVLQTASSAPGIFTLNSQGSGPGAVLVYDSTGFIGVNSASVPAAAGNVISIYATGEGQTSPPGVTGRITPTANVFPLLTPTTCTVGGQPGNVQFSGEANQNVAGVWLVNCQIPAGAGTGAVPLTISIAGNPSQTGVTVFLK
jgi:trimeric autotransporter adhesin